jgi:hypothetical protein
VNYLRKLARQPWGLVLGVGLILWGAASDLGQAQTFKVVQAKQQLFADPSFTAPPLGVAPEGAEVKVMQQSGDWYQVEYQGQTGWLHQQAFGGAKKVDLSRLLQGKAVPASRTDEVALAGKGFTPEVEADFRRKHPNLNYEVVDKVEAFQVSPGELQAFIQEGGLR